MKNVENVLDMVFQWIELTRREIEAHPEKMEAYHEELRQLTKTNFRFRENGSAESFASRGAEMMFEYSPEKILLGSVEVGAYDDQVAKTFMNRLRPENAMISIFDSDLNLDEGEWETEKWYGGPFQINDMTSDQLQTWGSPFGLDERLRLPKLNAYIPTDFSLRCDDDGTCDVGSEENEDSANTIEPPIVLTEKPGLRLWHKIDKKWRVPKTFIRMSIVSPNVYRSPRSMTLNRIFERVLDDDLNSFVYDAKQAGCSYG